jgi:thymidine kinase
MKNAFSHLSSEAGWIEVIAGCMFSGKTEELIRQLRRAKIARQPTQTFKPKIDARYSKDDVTSHDQTRIAAQPISEAEEILNLIQPETRVVGIDEGQFFSTEIVLVATELANQGRRVLIAGLDTDWRGRPFGPMPDLMSIAEIVHKQHAICRVCGCPATRTQRLVSDQQDILVGSSEAYEARCRAHFDPELSSRLLTVTDHPLPLSEL